MERGAADGILGGTDKRLSERQTQCAALAVRANERIPETAAMSAPGKVLYDLTEHWPCLIRYPEEGRLEHSSKPFVMGRETVCLQTRRLARNPARRTAASWKPQKETASNHTSVFFEPPERRRSWQVRSPIGRPAFCR